MEEHSVVDLERMPDSMSKLSLSAAALWVRLEGWVRLRLWVRLCSRAWLRLTERLRLS